MLPGHGYMRRNLVHLRGYSTHQYIADKPNLFLFCLEDQGDDALTEISPFEAK